MSAVQMTACPTWCDRSHETLARAGDFIHTTAEYVFAGERGGVESVYVLAEMSTDNDGAAHVSVSGAELLPADARRLAINLLELADVAEARR